MSIESYIRSLSMFDEMTDTEVAALASVAERRELPDGALVFEEGGEVEGLYIVEEGRVVIELTVQQGRRLQVTSVEPGHSFGWSAFSSHELSTATARCVEPTTLIVFDADRVEPLIKLDAHLGYVLLRAVVDLMSKRLQQTRMQLASVMLG